MARLFPIAVALALAACASPGDRTTQSCGDDPFAALLSQPSVPDVTLVRVSRDETQPGAMGTEALRVVNHSDRAVGYGPEVVLQRREGDDWTSVGQLNTSLGGRPDVIARCDPAYGTVLQLGQEALPGQSGPTETYSLPPLDEAPHRLVRPVIVGDRPAVLVLVLDASPAAP